MHFRGRHFIAAPQSAVWDALHDPEILRMTIPGCETMEKIDPVHFAATAKWKIGPVRVTANARIDLERVRPPHGLLVKAAGQGGVAGFAKGEADVTLMPEAGGTLIVYEVRAELGGKFLKLGQRLIHGTAQQVANGFFARFDKAIRSKAIENGGNLS